MSLQVASQSFQPLLSSHGRPDSGAMDAEAEPWSQGWTWPFGTSNVPRIVALLSQNERNKGSCFRFLGGPDRLLEGSPPNQEVLKDSKPNMGARLEELGLIHELLELEVSPFGPS